MIEREKGKGKGENIFLCSTVPLVHKYMKALIFILFITTMAMNLFAESSIDEFVETADAVKESLEQKKTEYRLIQTEYEAIIIKINLLKKSEGKNYFSRSINKFRLGYYLNKGNKQAYSMSILSNEIKDANEELFTYVSLILENINAEIEECIKTKCKDIQAVYEKRTKWGMFARDNEEILKFEISLEDFGGKIKSEARTDVKSYIDKKLIQIAQRLYLLAEEKRVLLKLSKQGIRINKSDLDDINIRIAELKVHNKVLRKEMERLSVSLKRK